MTFPPRERRARSGGPLVRTGEAGASGLPAR